MLISVIIPIYNTEKFLIKSLNSLKNQTYKQMEFILVNDGSTDNSGSICDEYCQQDERFTVIHKKNGSVSSARNTGLKVAKGQYIGFVDPDDWIEPTMFESLLNAMTSKQAQLSACGYRKERENGKLIQGTVQSNIITYDKLSALNTLLDATAFQGFVCNKLFMAEILRNEPTLLFDETIRYAEDLLFCCEYILKCQTIAFDPTPYYHYIHHSQNATKPSYNANMLSYLYALEKMIILVQERENIDTKPYKTFYTDTALSIIRLALKEKKCSHSELSQLKKKLYKYRLSDFTSSSVKSASTMARISIHLYYHIWKFRRIGLAANEQIAQNES